MKNIKHEVWMSCGYYIVNNMLDDLFENEFHMYLALSNNLTYFSDNI